MTPLTTDSGEFATVFNWDAPRSRKLSLLSFLAASLVLHALCFYIFQIIYPPAAGPATPPARVNIITPATEEGRELLQWIEAEDPALSSTTQRPPYAVEFAPPKTEHIPSYANRQPALHIPPPFAPDLRVPSSRPPAPVPTLRESTSSTPVKIATRIQFPATLGAPELPKLSFTGSNNETPQAARFLIGLSPRGDVRYCFLQNSSGDSSLDQQARRYLLLARFPPQDAHAAARDDLIWTTATIDWGNDIAAPAATAAPSPAP